MKFNEMMELAKAGYKPSEIKEMHDLEKLADPEEPKAEPKDEPKAEPKEEPKAEPKEESKAEPKDDPSKDLIDKLAEQQKLLEELQAKNRNKNLADEKKASDEETLTAAVRGFM